MLVPLQIVAVLSVVTTGAGLTVTVIVYATPTHKPVVEVGVTRYSTVPAARLLGLVRIWFMFEPELALAPEIPPVTVPMVQVKLLGVEAVIEMFGLTPLQIVAVADVVTTGTG
jgi:hypothetical protein